MITFYVYIHYRNDTGLPFYVGKGCFKRAWAKDGRNSHWCNIVNKVGYTVRILQDNITESAAFRLETKLIVALGVDTLANNSLGGEGPAGYKHTDNTKEKIKEKRKHQIYTEVTRKKMSENMKGKQRSLGYRHTQEVKNAARARMLGNTWAVGYRHTKEARKRIAQVNPHNCKPVICVETGEVFSSASAASRSVGALDGAIYQAIKRGYKYRGLTWRYISI